MPSWKRLRYYLTAKASIFATLYAGLSPVVAGLLVGTGSLDILLQKQIESLLLCCHCQWLCKLK